MPSTPIALHPGIYALNPHPSPQYNLSTCHAYNGDTDGALECVRQGVAAGLDFAAAVEAGKTEPRLCKLTCTTQVRQKMFKAAEEAAAKRAKGN